MGAVKGMEDGDGTKVEASHLLWHHLFDLWFHVAVHRFGCRLTSTERHQSLIKLHLQDERVFSGQVDNNNQSSTYYYC